MTDIHDYSDIINLPHHVSKTRRQMTMHDRAAQFSSFAALTGYGDAICEAGRLTNKRIELSESIVEILNSKICYLMSKINECPHITVTYFKADALKDGGAYIKKTGKIKKIDVYKRVIKFEDFTEIPVDDIGDIEGGIFKEVL